MNEILVGDVRVKLRELPEGIAQTCVLAYCAGVIDSDGTIGIKKSTYQMRVIGDCEQPTFSERVCVRQVEPQAIDVLHALFGGYRGVAKPSAENGRPLFSWEATNLRAATCLKSIVPYLRIKKAQAENCLALRDAKEQSKKARVAFGRGHAGSARRPSSLSERMEALFQRAHELNRVGRGN